MARIIFKEADGFDIPEPVLDPAALVADPVTAFPVDSGYQLEGGEEWVDGDADIGMAYVEPVTYDQVPNELTAADDLLGPIPGPTGDFDDNGDIFAPSPLEMGFDDGDEDDFVGEPLFVTEAFRLPGTSLVLNVGDRIHVVKTESAKFVTHESVMLDTVEASSLKEASPDDMLRKMAYGEDGDDITPDAAPFEVDHDDDDNGLVVDATQGLAYAEAQVAFHLPGTTGAGKIVFEKGDRLLIVGTLVEAEKDDDEDEEDDEKEEGGGVANFGKKKAAPFKKEGEVPPQFKPGYKKGDAKDDEKDDKEKDDKKDDKKDDDKKKDESNGLVSRKTSRRLGYSLRMSPNGKTFSTPGATGSSGQPGSI